MPVISVDWVYVLDRDYSYNVKHLLNGQFSGPCAFEDGSGTRRLEIDREGNARVFTGYAWDGCTPKFAIFDIVIGTPDGMPNLHTTKPKTYYASLLHDVLYQFLDVGLPMERRQADRAFLELMERDGFAPRALYYRVVRLLGGLAHCFTTWKRNYAGRRVDL